jgi:hypothetical protein
MATSQGTPESTTVVTTKDASISLALTLFIMAVGFAAAVIWSDRDVNPGCVVACAICSGSLFLSGTLAQALCRSVTLNSVVFKDAVQPDDATDRATPDR